MLVMLQSSIAHSAVETEKIASDGLWTNSDVLSGLPEWLLEARRCCQEAKLYKLFLIIVTIFELFISAAALLPTSTAGHC